jgi:hypothetical protein
VEGRALARTAFALIPIALGFGQFVPLYVAPGEPIWYQYRSVALYPVDALVAWVVVVWLAERIRRRPRADRAWPAAAFGFALLAVASLLSAITSVDRAITFTVAAHLSILALFALAVSDLGLLARPKTVITLASAALLAQSVLAGWQELTQSTAPAGLLFNRWSAELAAGDSGASVAALPWTDRWLRAYGSFPHPNILAAFLAVVIVVVLARGVRSRLEVTSLVAAFLALVATFSRTGALALALGVVVWILAMRGMRALTWSMHQLRARPALVILLAIGVLAGGARLARLDAPNERRTFDERALYASAAQALVARGVPVGAGGIVIAEQSVDVGRAIGEPAHDTFLIAWAELGPLGLVAWLVLFAALALSAWRRRAEPLGRSGPLAAAAVVLPVLLLDHYLWTQPTGRTLLAWVLVSLSTLQSEQKEHASGARPATFVTG